MRVVVIDDDFHVFEKHPAIARLRQAADVTVYEQAFPSQDGLVEALRGVPVIIANRERTLFPCELLKRLPDLRLISNTGTHVYHVDVDAATERGILLCNAPGGSSPSVAELTIGFILTLARGIPANDDAMHDGAWPIHLWSSVQGKTLGILGMGKVGTRVAHGARGLEMDVVAWGPTLNDERAASAGVRRVELDDVFPQADFVSNHLMLSDLSRGLIDRRRLSLMKPTSFLINTARGAIVDEAALVEALKQGSIAGAALDVFVQEPLPADSPLRKLDNVLLSPHAGWTTHEAFGPWIEMVVENILSYMDGKPIRVQNPDALEHQG
ncbi:MAG TPA: D-2-hydroxyacid dehydrogenase family protein [Chloroflexota bacterium]|jgi:D-3-phosphoglycerate dehydrogenase